MPLDENKIQDEQKEVSVEAETVDVVSEKPVSAEIVVESEAVEPPKVEEVKSEQIEKSVLNNVEQIEQPQNQTPPTT